MTFCQRAITMSPELEHTLTWMAQTLVVGAVVIMLGAVFGVESLFIEYGMESRSIVRLILLSILALGSVFFLFLNVSQLIDEKTSGPLSESTTIGESDDSIR